MALVLNRIADGWDVLDSFCCRFLNASKSSLIIVKRHSVEVHAYDITDGTKSLTLSLVASLPIKERVEAANVVYPPGRLTCWLLLLTEQNNLYILGTKRHEFILLERLHFASNLRSQLTIDEEIDKVVTNINVTPVLQVDPTNTYVLIHSCHNFVQILYLDPQKKDLFAQVTDQVESPLIRKRKLGMRLLTNQIFGEPIVVFLGTEVIQSIKFLTGTSFCTISRNPNLKYSVTYYLISRLGKAMNVNMIQRFPILEGVPRHVVPLHNKGLLITCDGVHHIFPPVSHIITSSTYPNAVKRGCYSKSLDKDEDSFSGICSIQEICPNILLLSHVDGMMHIGIINSTIVENHTSSTISRKKSLRIDDWNYIALGKYSVCFNKIIPLSSTLFFGTNIFGDAGLFFLDKNTSLQSLHPSHKHHNYASATVPANGNLKDSLFSSIIGHGKSSVTKAAEPEMSHEVSGEIKQMISFPHSVQGDVVILLKEDLPDSVSAKRRFSLEIIKQDKNLKTLSEYKFDSGTYVFDLMSTNMKISTCTPEAEIKLSEIQDQLTDSFLVGTTSVSEEGPQTELLLFVIDEAGKLDISAMASLNKEFSSILKRDADIILLSAGSLVWLTLGIYYDRDEQDVRLKIDLQSKMENLIFGYPALGLNFKDGIVLADVFEGLMYIPIIKRQLHGSVMKIQEGTFSAIAKLGKDGFLVGDILGNVFLFRTTQKSGFELIKEFNISDSCIVSIQSVVDDSISIKSLLVSDNDVNQSTPSIALICTKTDGLYELSMTAPSETLERVVSLQNFIIENQPSIDFPNLSLDVSQMQHLVEVLTTDHSKRSPEEIVGEKRLPITWRPIRVSPLEKMFSVNTTENSQDVFPLSSDQIAVVHAYDIKESLPSSLGDGLSNISYFG